MKYVRQIGIILGITLAGEFLNQILPLPVPAGVYILECADELKAVLIPFLIIIAVSTVVVMIVTGKVAQFMMESAEKKKEK